MNVKRRNTHHPQLFNFQHHACRVSSSSSPTSTHSNSPTVQSGSSLCYDYADHLILNNTATDKQINIHKNKTNKIDKRIKKNYRNGFHSQTDFEKLSFSNFIFFNIKYYAIEKKKIIKKNGYSMSSLRCSVLVCLDYAFLVRI